MEERVRAKDDEKKIVFILTIDDCKDAYK